jgi:hypothetical protein
VASQTIIEFVKAWVFILPDVLLLASAYVVYRRRQFADFPLFFIYLCTVALNDAIRIIAALHFGLNSWPHFYVYWGTDKINIVLSFAVLYEVLKNVLTSGTIKISRSTFFLIVAVLFLASAVLAYVTTVPGKDPALMRLILSMEGVVRFAQIGVLLMFTVLTIFFGFYWGNQAFGISAGFGFYAAILLVDLYFRRVVGPAFHARFALIDISAYLLATAIWLIYALKRKPKPPASLPSDNLSEFEEPLKRSAPLDGAML